MKINTEICNEPVYGEDCNYPRITGTVTAAIRRNEKEIAIIKEDIQKLVEIKQRAEEHYNNFINFISTHTDEIDRQNARVMIIAIGKILGYSNVKIDTDIKEAYGVE